MRVLQVVLGKPEACPALVLNTAFRKPRGQLPLAGVKAPDVPDVPDPLPPALFALEFEGEVDAGLTRVSPVLP